MRDSVVFQFWAITALALTEACGAVTHGNAFSMNGQLGGPTSVNSYSMNLASPSRNGRLDARARKLQSITRVAPLDQAPVYVLANSSGDRVALDFDRRFEVRDANGSVTSKGQKIANATMVLWNQSILVMGDELSMGGKPGTVTLFAHADDGDTEYASRVGPTDASYIVQRRPHPLPDRQENPAQTMLSLSTEKFYTAERSNGTDEWTEDLPGTGCGAIATDGRMVIAMTDQRFIVYERKLRGKDKRHPIPTAQARLGFVPEDISIVEEGAAILSGGAGPREIHLVDLQGHEQWKANVAFAVEAPPLDGADGRVYVVGKGIAAFENGKALWSQPSSASVHATSLADGSLLVAVGAELRVVARDGTIKQTLKVAEGDAIVAPPAVTADGVVWLATAKGLYVAR